MPWQISLLTTLLGHDSGWIALQGVDIPITPLRYLTPMMTYPRCPGTVERAFAPLVEYFGYKWAIGDKNDNRALYHFEPYLGPALAAAVEALQLWSTPVHVVDLHGDRARTARERLAQPLRGILRLSESSWSLEMALGLLCAFQPGDHYSRELGRERSQTIGGLFTFCLVRGSSPSKVIR